MNRILIIGCPGSGKSTLAKQLGERTGIPVIHLDQHFWHPGWVQTPIPDWLDRVEELVQGESWIIDGNYARSLPIRIRRADGVIWLDFPRLGNLWRCLWRVVRTLGKTRPDMAPGCHEKFDWQFVQYIWTFDRTERPVVVNVLEIEGRGIPVMHLRKIRELDLEKIVGFISKN